MARGDRAGARRGDVGAVDGLPRSAGDATSCAGGRCTRWMRNVRFHEALLFLDQLGEPFDLDAPEQVRAAVPAARRRTGSGSPSGPSTERTSPGSSVGQPTDFIFFLTTRTPVRYYDGMNGARVVALVTAVGRCRPGDVRPERASPTWSARRSRSVAGSTPSTSASPSHATPAGRAGCLRGAVVTAGRRRSPGGQGRRAGGTARRGVRPVAGGARRPGRRQPCRPGMPMPLAGVVNDLDERGRSDLKELESTLVDSAKTSIGRGSSTREVRKLGQHPVARRRCAPPRAAAPAAVRAPLGRPGQPGCATPTWCSIPQTDAAVAAALGAADQPPSRPQRPTTTARSTSCKADALVGLITGARGGGRGVPEVSVLIDLDTLRHGLHDQSVCETVDG